MSNFPGGGNDGGFTIRRFIQNVPVAWTQVNFRQADWMGACPQLTAAEKTRAMVVGEVRRVTVQYRAGTRIEMAEEEVPGDRICSVDATRLEKTLRFGNVLGKATMWWQGVAGTEDAEVEVSFDIPREEDLA